MFLIQTLTPYVGQRGSVTQSKTFVDASDHQDKQSVCLRCASLAGWSSGDCCCLVGIGACDIRWCLLTSESWRQTYQVVPGAWQFCMVLTSSVRCRICPNTLSAMRHQLDDLMHSLVLSWVQAESFHLQRGASASRSHCPIDCNVWWKMVQYVWWCKMSHNSWYCKVSRVLAVP